MDRERLDRHAAAVPAHVTVVDVHVRRVSRCSPVELRGVLTAPEAARADRFFRRADADRFVVARATLRTAVAARLGIAPSAVPLEQDANGKPVVAGGPHVSVSHSGDVAIVALASAPVGVDVEQIDPRHTREPLGSFFSAAEIAAIEQVPSELRERAFFHAWTSREAIAKAIGLGLSLPREAFDVAVDPREPPALQTARAPEVSGPFTLVAIAAVPADYVAMLAVRAAAVSAVDISS